MRRKTGNPLASRTLLLLLLITFSLTTEALNLSWVGCGITRKAFMSDLAAAYEKKTGITIGIEGGGATKGIRSIASKQADIGGACRYRLDGSLKEVNARMIPVAWDALVVVVHKDNPIDSISLDQLKRLYLGKIQNWSELGGENLPIDLLIREGKISGVGYSLRKLLFEDYDLEFKSQYIYKSSGPLEKAVEVNPRAVAVTGVASAYKRDFKILKLEGKDPSFENIRRGKYFLYRPLFLVFNYTSENSKDADRFIQFALGPEGRKIIRKNHVVPYFDGMLLIQRRLMEWDDFRAKALSNAKSNR